MITTQKDLRRAFWSAHQGLQRISKRKINGDYNTDTRCAFVDYVDACSRCGLISTQLAQRVTL